ncbi:hypothetical protein [Trujillonella endophytica]|uniref:Uncharacterized protein n=1 Tax=Trujillonella endophytica TaxID=673521 RepID=A0A1H8T2E9_9ACTN|nr:hypothetical protein [Trujillella endophytica]SEO84768.1 hypothetical protein SAMN05660991_01997 [Trujillella endophytica]
MTEPGTAPDADRAEQEALLTPPAPGTAGEAAPVADGVPEADALDQQLATRPGEAAPPTSVGYREADDADVLEQAEVVPVDEDDVPG